VELAYAIMMACFRRMQRPDRIRGKHLRDWFLGCLCWIEHRNLPLEPMMSADRHACSPVAQTSLVWLPSTATHWNLSLSRVTVVVHRTLVHSTSLDIDADINVLYYPCFTFHSLLDLLAQSIQAAFPRNVTSVLANKHHPRRPWIVSIKDQIDIDYGSTRAWSFRPSSYIEYPFLPTIPSLASGIRRLCASFHANLNRRPLEE
jgi:hypothetical protein